jgi:prolyl 4-hydroxylase
LPHTLACAPAADQFGNKAPFTPIDPGVCADADANCKDWAKAGECERNARFMTGDLGNPGACSLSCGKCKPCPKVRVGMPRGECAALQQQQLGVCRAAVLTELCRWLVVHAQDDKACYDANRRQAGYLVYGNDLDSDEGRPAR